MSKYETHTNQFGLVNSIRQPVSDLITVAEPRALFAPEARKGRLYMVVETDGDIAKGHQACQLVARTVRKAFYEDSSFSITSSLREAIRSANEALYKHNFNAPMHRRAHVGLTCAVLKENDLFLAQVAPTQAYVLSEGKIRALPTHLSWNQAHLSATPFTEHSALGCSLFIDPELYRCRLQPEDGLLLCSSNLAHLLGAADVSTLLEQADSAEALEALYRLCIEDSVAEAHAILVKLLPPLSMAAQSRPVSRAGLSERSRLFVHRLGRWFSGVTGEVALATRSQRNHDQHDAAAEERPKQPAEAPRKRTASFHRHQMQIPPEPPIVLSAMPPKPLPIDMGESLQQRRERELASTPLPPSAFLGEGSYDSPQAGVSEPIDLGDLMMASPHAQPYSPRYQRRPLVDMSLSERLMLPFSWFGTWLAPATHRPTYNPYLAAISDERMQRLVRQRQRPAFPWLLLVLLVITITFLILYGISLSRRSADERTLTYLNEAEHRMAAVYEATNGDDAAERLEVAAQAIEEVRESPLITVTNAAFWLRYQGLQQKYERAQSSIHLITYLDDVKVLANHPLPRGRFASVVVPPSTVNVTDTYVLDALRYIYALDVNGEAARLYRIPREGGEPQPYLQPEDVVRNTIVGSIRAHAWRLTGVVAVDEGNNGFGYYFQDADKWNYIRLGGSEIWTPGARIDLETYEGHLYVWGGEPNEVLKFSSGRYGDIPQFWLDPAGLQGHDIGTSVDMAVDGYIYLLQPNGHVLVLNLGRFEREISVEGVTPPVTATRFFVTGTPDQGWIFLLDTPNERIIQIDKISGQVLQRMSVRAESAVQLNQLTDIYVDDSAGRPMIYLVNGGQILQARMPIPPTPFTPSAPSEVSTDTLSPDAP